MWWLKGQGGLKVLPWDGTGWTGDCSRISYFLHLESCENNSYLKQLKSERKTWSVPLFHQMGQIKSAPPSQYYFTCVSYAKGLFTMSHSPSAQNWLCFCCYFHNIKWWIVLDPHSSFESLLASFKSSFSVSSVLSSIFSHRKEKKRKSQSITMCPLQYWRTIISSIL